MSAPIIALVGRPNVGKSSLFNLITKTRNALVYDEPGVTRDRIYGYANIGETRCLVIDTGGLYSDDSLNEAINAQALEAINEAGIVLFMVDAHAGIVAHDLKIAQKLRSCNKPVYLVVNKIDGINIDELEGDFYSLGFPVFTTSAAHNRGVRSMLEEIVGDVNVSSEETASILDEPERIKLAIIGKPNVGKSTLVNQILKEERVLVADVAGVTHDSIYIPCEYKQQKYTLIDTAGIRKRTKVNSTVEKFSVLKALHAIKDAHVVVFVIDATQTISDQDLSLLGMVIESGSSIVIACNKADLLSAHAKSELTKDLEYRLRFASFARIYFISAKQNFGIKTLFDEVKSCYKSAMRDLSTSKLTTIVRQAVKEHMPPITGKHRIKLRYAHSGGKNPPVIVIHGNQVQKLPNSYKSYLSNYFISALRLSGTPLKLIFKNSDNPFV